MAGAGDHVIRLSVQEWRAYAVKRFGESSRAVAWLDKLGRENNEGPGQVIEDTESRVIHVLEQLDAGELEVE